MNSHNGKTPKEKPRLRNTIELWRWQYTQLRLRSAPGALASMKKPLHPYAWKGLSLTSARKRCTNDTFTES